MLWLVWFDSDVALDRFQDACQLRAGLWLVRSDATRSRVYHCAKRSLPQGTALLVAPLADAPKFKGMAPGSLSFVRGFAE